METILILMSHGNFAKEILNSAQMIVGEIEGSYPICMSAEEGLSGISEKIETLLSEHKDKQILIMADLFGGTPFNAAVIKKNQSENIQILTGMNLGMVIEYAVSPKENLLELATNLKQIGLQGIQIQTNTEDEDIDF